MHVGMERALVRGVSRARRCAAVPKATLVTTDLRALSGGMWVLLTGGFSRRGIAWKRGSLRVVPGQGG